jgi:hypothetical protein
VVIVSLSDHSLAVDIVAYYVVRDEITRANIKPFNIFLKVK